MATRTRFHYDKTFGIDGAYLPIPLPPPLLD